jgi:hypothetical protein
MTLGRCSGVFGWALMAQPCCSPRLWAHQCQPATGVQLLSTLERFFLAVRFHVNDQVMGIHPYCQNGSWQLG